MLTVYDALGIIIFYAPYYYMGFDLISKETKILFVLALYL